MFLIFDTETVLLLEIGFIDEIRTTLGITRSSNPSFTVISFIRKNKFDAFDSLPFANPAFQNFLKSKKDDLEKNLADD